MQQTASQPTTSHGPAADPARIGPNALIQSVAALRARYGAEQTAAILRRGGHARLLDELPTHMVPEQEFTDLATALVAQLGVDESYAILYQAGRLTGDYLLAHRIPLFFQRLLRLLPPRLALALFCYAIGKHAWTFAGSGSFRYYSGRVPCLEVESSIRPVAAVQGFYGGAFARLIQAILDPQAQIVARPLSATQPACCRYDVHFHR